MELFVINRYHGEHPNDNSVANETDIKEKLFKKIKGRQRITESFKVEDEDDIHKDKKRIKLSANEFVTDNENILYNDSKKNAIRSQKKKAEKIAKEKKILNLNHVLLENRKQMLKKEKQNDKVNVVKEKRERKEKLESECNVEEIDQNETEKPGFTILGVPQMFKKEKIKRKLPNWLANPSVVSVDLKNLTHTIESIPELDKIFIDQLKQNNITHFFPVQSQIIPWLLNNSKKPLMYWSNDICVSAPTGSGKTLAFVLPLLQILYRRIVPKIRVLVVLPVQDLAVQVFNVFKNYSKPTDLNILLLSKKRPFQDEQALICSDDGFGHYNELVDIIITTPGRLVEHLAKTKGLYFNNLDYLVIDEADRVLEKVQNDWLHHLNRKINAGNTRSYQMPIISYNNMINGKKPPNKLLFSATLSQDPEKLQQLKLFLPKLFTSVVKSKSKEKRDIIDESKFIGKFTTPNELTEYSVTCTKANKPLILHHLLKQNSWRNVLCFVNSAETTKRLAFVIKYLSENTIKIGKLSASLPVRKRNIVLQAFSKGELDVSDALARGIDIPNVQYVISYDAPKYIKTYIHRIGRTGRAGKEGTSLVLLTSKEVNNFQKLIEIAGKNKIKKLKIESDELAQYENRFEKAVNSLATILKKQTQRELFRERRKQKLTLLAANGRKV